MTKVGLPGSPIGISPQDPTLAELLKPHGYVSGQFGKNHLGDRNEFLPTVHGFDEFFGNLYHLNAEEEPENEDYPKDPAFRARFGPRGVLDTKASDTDDPTVDPRFGKVGKQTIKDTGPLTRKRMLSVVISGFGMVLLKEWELVQVGEYSARTAKQLTLTVIEAIDMFLVGAISYIIAVGLYLLFVGDRNDPLFKRFDIGSLADLENKVIGVVVVAMAVGFVGKASDAPGPLAVLQSGAGVALVIAALCLFVRFSGPSEKS